MNLPKIFIPIWASITALVSGAGNDTNTNDTQVTDVQQTKPVGTGNLRGATLLPTKKPTIPSLTEKPTTLKPAVTNKPTTLKPTVTNKPTTLKPTTYVAPFQQDANNLVFAIIKPADATSAIAGLNNAAIPSDLKLNATTTAMQIKEHNLISIPGYKITLDNLPAGSAANFALDFHNYEATAGLKLTVAANGVIITDYNNPDVHKQLPTSAAFNQELATILNHQPIEIYVQNTLFADHTDLPGVRVVVRGSNNQMIALALRDFGDYYQANIITPNNLTPTVSLFEPNFQNAQIAVRSFDEALKFIKISKELAQYNPERKFGHYDAVIEEAKNINATIGKLEKYNNINFNFIKDIVADNNQLSAQPELNKFITDMHKQIDQAENIDILFGKDAKEYESELAEYTPAQILKQKQELKDFITTLVKAAYIADKEPAIFEAQITDLVAADNQPAAIQAMHSFILLQLLEPMFAIIKNSLLPKEPPSAVAGLMVAEDEVYRDLSALSTKIPSVTTKPKTKAKPIPPNTSDAKSSESGIGGAILTAFATIYTAFGGEKNTHDDSDDEDEDKNKRKHTDHKL